MNTIRIITTKGCDGCYIAKNLVNKAINSFSEITIKVEYIDCLNEDYRTFIKQYAIKDFPTIIFMKGDIVMSIHTGTMPVPQLLHEIKLWFN